MEIPLSPTEEIEFHDFATKENSTNGDFASSKDKSHSQCKEVLKNPPPLVQDSLGTNFQIKNLEDLTHEFFNQMNATYPTAFDTYLSKFKTSKIVTNNQAESRIIYLLTKMCRNKNLLIHEFSRIENELIKMTEKISEEVKKNILRLEEIQKYQQSRDVLIGGIPTSWCLDLPTHLKK